MCFPLLIYSYVFFFQSNSQVSKVCGRVYMYRVPSDMPLYDILNEFQKGSSHMAAVVKARGKGKETPQIIDEEKNEENKSIGGDSQLTTPLLQKQDAKSGSVVVDIVKPSKPSSINKLSVLQRSDSTTNGPSSENIEDGEVIGIITLEDVFEELLQVNFCLLRHYPLSVQCLSFSNPEN